MKNNKRQPDSTLSYILKSLAPYTDANLKLNFKPHLFFNDLEKISGRNRQSIRNAYYKAKRGKLISIDENGNIALSATAMSKIELFTPQKLYNNAQLLVIFDIPENMKYTRRKFRKLLQSLDFNQVQKSVWASSYDHIDTISEAIEALDIFNYVLFFEAAKINK